TYGRVLLMCDRCSISSMYVLWLYDWTFISQLLRRRRRLVCSAGGLLAPAFPRRCRLYSAVNRRRVAFAVTSISGPPGARSSTLIVLQSLLALDTKLPGGRCLTHIGREGESRLVKHSVYDVAICEPVDERRQVDRPL